MMTGSGGWPLTIIMTPEKAPFFAATYIPKTSKFGRVGLLELIPEIKNIWRTRRADVTDTAARISDALIRISAGGAGAELDGTVLETAYEQLRQRFDEANGGFGGAPKFPTPHNLFFLLRYWRRSGDNRALEMVEKTLEMMRRGGIYDHVGFGFHRYSTDNLWRVPHFEKMLYDQALLTMAYTEAYLATGKPVYRKTVDEIISYVLRDMTSQEGVFYSAEDADSEGEEGKFYVWAPEEIGEVLDGETADLFMRAYHVEPDGNFTDEAKGTKSESNILHLTHSLAEIADQASVPAGTLTAKIEAARRRLFAHRERRIHPDRDDKTLTNWNGLMIAALAKAGNALGRVAYTEAARCAADFILDRMSTTDGRLLHRYRDGEAAITGNLNDYAFLTWGLIELYEACHDARYLETALRLSRTMLVHFWDDEQGGLYFTPDDGESLLVRRKEVYDGAIPSGNSVAMFNLLRLGRMTGDPDLEECAAEIGRAFSASIREAPIGSTQLLVALDFAVGPSYEIVIAGDADGADTSIMLNALRSAFLPNKVVLLKPKGQEASVARIAPFTESHSAIGSKATAYVCQDHKCGLPTTDPDEMLRMLEG
jgi:hypothetical protein